MTQNCSLAHYLVVPTGERWIGVNRFVQVVSDVDGRSVPTSFGVNVPRLTVQMPQLIRRYGRSLHQPFSRGLMPPRHSAGLSGSTRHTH